MVESQAIGRVQRLGQTRNVRVIRYIAKGTVEEVWAEFVLWNVRWLVELGNAISAGEEARLCKTWVEGVW